jgi:hypothetical protein
MIGRTSSTSDGRPCWTCCNLEISEDELFSDPKKAPGCKQVYRDNEKESKCCVCGHRFTDEKNWFQLDGSSDGLVQFIQVSGLSSFGIANKKDLLFRLRRGLLQEGTYAGTAEFPVSRRCGPVVSIDFWSLPSSRCVVKNCASTYFAPWGNLNTLSNRAPV